jgi:hexosaminidase
MTPRTPSLLPAALVVSTLTLALPATAELPSTAGHDLMPAPQRLEWQPGPHAGAGRLVLDKRFSLASTGVADPRIDAALGRALARLKAQTKLPLASPGRGRSDATLVVAAAAPGLPVQAVGEDESYELTVSARQARLTAPNPLGVLRGLETFLDLVSEEGGRHFVPAVKISDRPRFPWRGLLIDPCRRWQPVEVIKRNLDAMAAVKLNVLHWHLSEDQGFRIESKVFPRLHTQGSDGLYYTQDQVRDVIAYARERGIRVVAEFDMPGHATSWLVGHPELGAAPGPFAIVRTWGIFDDVLDPTKDEVYAFLNRFLGEMAALFPDPYLHIGGDEVTPRAWNANPAVLDYMYRHDLADAADLQAHFNRRVNEILTRHGKRMVGWDEVLRPDLPKNIVVQSWRGAEALGQAATLGYDGILSNGYYLDLMFPASAHYLTDPIPAESKLSAEARGRILGGEACMWGEFVSPETIDSRLWPRAAAVAERLWSPAEVRDVEDMYRRLEIESVRLEATGVQHRSNYAPMLKRLSGGQPIEPLQVLADLVEPVKGYARGQLRAYTSAMPLDHLVDAARAESMAARRFRGDVDAFLKSPVAARDDKALRAALVRWRDNHRVLEPILTASPLAAEARSLSKDLSALGALGLQALDAVAAGQAPPAPWQEQAQSALARARKARAEVELAVVPPVRKLTLAAQHIETLKALPPDQWNPWLDALLKKTAAAVKSQ